MQLSSVIVLVLAWVYGSSAQDDGPQGPIEPDTTSRCTHFDTAFSKLNNCQYFEDWWGISHEEFVAWNPSVKDDCSGIKVGNSYCVEAPPPETTTTSTGSSTPSNIPKPSPTQDGLIETCTAFYKAVKGDTCAKVVQKYGTFTLEQFLAWNPAVESDCSGIWAETYYCVGVPGTPTAPVSVTATTITATTTSSPPLPSPTQDGLIKTCTAFYKAVKGDTCAKVVQIYGTFTLEQFIVWNPAVESDCSGIWAETYYCVGIPGTPTAPPTSRTTTTRATTTSTGVAKPSPTQDGLIGSCTQFYKAVKDDTCDAIVKKYGYFTLAQFKSWNPAVGDDCKGLWAETYYCVGIPGLSTTLRTTTTSSTRKTTTTTSTTTKGNGVATPTPTQANMVGNCDQFYFVKKDETCHVIASRYGLSQQQLYNWNPSIKSDCTGFWADVWVCVHTIGYTYQPTMTCSDTSKTWGGNQPAALDSVTSWCNGDASTDGSGGFATNQVKTGCYNALLGTNKINFLVRNDFGIGKSLSVAQCNELVKLPINRCTRGGEAKLESWYVQALVSDGRC